MTGPINPSSVRYGEPYGGDPELFSQTPESPSSMSTGIPFPSDNNLPSPYEMIQQANRNNFGAPPGQDPNGYAAENFGPPSGVGQPATGGTNPPSPTPVTPVNPEKKGPSKASIERGFEQNFMEGAISEMQIKDPDPSSWD